MRCNTRFYSQTLRGLTNIALFSAIFTHGVAWSEESVIAQNSLIIGTWGGPYEAAQDAALFVPFEQYTGLDISTTDYTGGLEVFDEPSPPHILDMLEDEAEIACQAGLLKPITHDSISRASITGSAIPRLEVDDDTVGSDTFDERDFHRGAFKQCSVAHLTFSTLIAYDERAFTGEKPAIIGDLFDLERFPGKRALQRSPAALFEWAMMAEGVPISQIYDLLSTRRGLRLVLERLESLRGHVMWWDTPGEAVSLLEQGDVVMASGYNGRFFDVWSRGVPINMIWDGQIVDRSVWALPSNSAMDTATALSFIRFALHPERLAYMARQIPYGPIRTSAFRYIGLHPVSGVVMSDHLPTAEHHLANALHRDTHWYARTAELREQYFSNWMAGNSQ